MVEILDATSQVEDLMQLQVVLVVSRDPVVETEHPQPCLLETLVSRPNNTILSHSSHSVVPLRLLELHWVMMAELRDSLMLNLKAQRVQQRPLNLTAQRSLAEHLDSIYPNHLAAAVVATEVEEAEEVASAVVVVASEIEVASVEEAVEASEIEAAEAASVIEAEEAAEAASVAEEVALTAQETQAEDHSDHKTNQSDSER